MASGKGALKTEFAPAERSTPSEIMQQSKSVAVSVTFQYVADYIPNVFLILNDNRQIIFANETAIKLFGAKDFNSIMGLRFGEALGCENHFKSDGGCGTTETCSTCGMVKATLVSLKGDDCVDECHITLKDGDALDMSVYTFSIKYNGQNFVSTVLTDISDQKRRNAMESIFFHDVMNTLGALRGFTELLPVAPTIEKKEEIIKRVFGLTNRVIDEVYAQRDLVKAENRELSLTVGTVNSLELLREIKEQYERQDLAQGKNLVINNATQEIEFKSDKTLLMRVVGNMVKNALEASDSGDNITLGSSKIGQEVLFSVNNPKYMPRDIQLQIFRRYFSTKGSSRGLGTYSMRLLSERYLKGVVSFTSTEAKGTTFTARYPLKLD